MKKIQQQSLEELTKSETLLRAILIAYGIIGVIIFFLLLYIQAKPILFVPVGVLPITGLPLIIVLKGIKEEIAKRKADPNG
jgi:archaellum biogenesis protein FlaJ (TadC family)